MIAVSKASTEDIPNIVKLVNKAYRGESSRRGWTHELDFLAGDIRIDEGSLQEIIETENGAILLAQSDGATVGTVHLRLDNQGLYLGMLSVDPDYQNAGLGSVLLAAADAYAKEQKAPLIYMIVISEREELIAWYCRRGYRVSGPERPFKTSPKFGTPLKDLFMVELHKSVMLA